MKRSLLACVAGLLCLAVPALAADAPAAIEIKADRGGTAIQLVTEGARCTLMIHGGRPGGATLTRTGEHWPVKLTLRLYLSGLEQFTIASGDEKLEASVLSHGDHQRLLHLWKNQEEGPQLTKASEYWMEIEIFDSAGKPINKLPEKGGWFEMTVPKAMLKDANKAVHIGWIAFFL